jgi:dUTP pyrophosphatase
LTEIIPIKLQLLNHAKGLNIPQYSSDGAAGMDIEAAVEDTTILTPMERIAIPTGLMMEIPPGYEVQIRPRSGLALKQGLTVANAPGTIDSDYRGEVKVILVNLGTKEAIITRGMRIAQMILASVAKSRFVTVDILDKTTRGAGGFGSTDV